METTANTPKRHFFSFTLPELEQYFALNQLSKSGASLLFKWHYKLNQTHPCSVGLAHTTQEFLAEKIDFSLPILHQVHESQDGTVKLVLTFQDGQQVDSVLIPFQGKYTQCLSSQVGCAMNCQFCFTGTQGLKRHLGVEEIVGQVVLAKQWLKQHRPKMLLSNLVFMGQGEPLHNMDAVAQACNIFLTRQGWCFADHKITVSTAGYLPGLKRWNSIMPGVNLALSLHATDQELRSQLIPINRKYPLAEVLEEIQYIPLGKKRFITFEYLVLDQFNDSPQEMHALGTLLQGRRAFINLIPFNPFPGSQYQRPSAEKMEQLKVILDQYHLPTTIRKTKGDPILAACGQLNSVELIRGQKILR